METREDLGYVASDPEINRRIRDHLRSSSLSSILEKAKEIAYRDFSPFEPGESVGVREIKNRLSEIRQAGYDLQPYSHMTKKEAWEYLAKVKRDLSGRVNFLR